MATQLSLLIHGEQSKKEFSLPNGIEVITFTGDKQPLLENEGRVLFDWIRNDYDYLAKADWKAFHSQKFLINGTTTTINCYRPDDLCPNLSLWFVHDQTEGDKNVLGFYNPSEATLANVHNLRPTEGRIEYLTTQLYGRMGDERFTLETLTAIIPKVNIRLYLFCCRGGESPEHFMNEELIPTHRINSTGLKKIPTPNNMKNTNGGYRRKTRRKTRHTVRRKPYHKK